MIQKIFRSSGAALSGLGRRRGHAKSTRISIPLNPDRNAKIRAIRTFFHNPTTFIAWNLASLPVPTRLAPFEAHFGEFEAVNRFGVALPCADLIFSLQGAL